MKVLVIGGGGREHAICMALNKSPKVDKLFCLPGNAGIAQIATCLEGSVFDFDKIINFSKTNSIDLVFVAPDDPLAKGLVDVLNQNGIRAFGPTKAGARLESSKAFSKAFMKRHNIPSANYQVFDDMDKAMDYVKNASFPLVLKADGLALGKGVLICENLTDAIEGIKELMLYDKFNGAGKTIVIEEFLKGREVTVLTFCDGKTIKAMPSSQDHKRAFDGDKGLNTGGMGAFAPSPYFTDDYYNEFIEKIATPTLNALIEEGIEYKGVLYFGLMMTDNGLKVIEYNARFGDPETQVILPLLDTDFVDIINACIDSKLDEIDIKWKKATGFTVVIASGGYPQSYNKGYKVTFGDTNGLIVYHAGTKFDDGNIVTNGGRVFDVTCVAEDIAHARKIVYSKIDNIKFKDSFYRKDIGLK